MKKLIFALTLMFVAGTASAGFTCQQVGQFTYCNDTAGGYGTSGGSVTCQTVGDFTYCN
jgi:hypothetical protein